MTALGEAERRADLATRRLAEARKAWHDARTEDLHAQAALRNARRNAGLCGWCGVLATADHVEHVDR